MEFIERNVTSDKAAWLEKRKHYVTGTDAAQLLGISPFGSKFSVWLDKTGQGQEIAQTGAMRAGLAFEAEILRMYAEDTDAKVEHMDGYDLKTSDAYPRLGASLDGWNHTLGIPVDSKNIRWKTEKWGDAWTSDFPEYYKTQLQELVQQKKNQVLSYALVGESGPDHDKQFDVEVSLNGCVVGSGSGSSKKRAEQSAAASAIEKLFPNKM